MQRRRLNRNNVTGLAIASLLSFHHKGMLANLMGGFIAILVGLSLAGPIAQEINNAIDCQNSTLINVLVSGNISTSQPQGSTGSFGGAGSNHFGGYTGEVKHNVFVDALASTSMVKSDKSLLNPECTPITGAAATLLSIVTIFFTIGIIGILAMALAMIYSSLCSAGLVGSPSEVIDWATKKNKKKKKKGKSKHAKKK
jgi:hypothetical protein